MIRLGCCCFILYAFSQIFYIALISLKDKVMLGDILTTRGNSFYVRSIISNTYPNDPTPI